MPSLRDIKKHISSVKSIKKITYAMKMVAVARIKKAQNSMFSARPFSLKMEEVVKQLYNEMNEENFKKSKVYNLFKNENPKENIGLILITSDKGLCGAFNSNLIKKAVLFLKNNNDKNIHLITVGKKGRDFLKRIKIKNIEFYYEMFGIFPKVNYTHSHLLVEKILNMYKEKKLSTIYIIYNDFKNMISQNLKEETFLPLFLYEKEGKTDNTEFEFEPDKILLLENLLERNINSKIYRILLESQAAELSARMNAMENASKNASELMDDLTLVMNKKRQAMITTELTEIVNGSQI